MYFFPSFFSFLVAQPPPKKTPFPRSQWWPLSDLASLATLTPNLLVRMDVLFLVSTGANLTCPLRSNFYSSEFQKLWFCLAYQVLLELARNRNKIPLPKSIAGPGVSLPPEQDTLINPNYQLAIAKKQISQSEETEEDEESADPNPAPTQNPSVSHEKADVPQGTPQRVSFPLGAKRPRWCMYSRTLYNGCLNIMKF